MAIDPDCCMARHATATAPWICDCPCHQAVETPEAPSAAVKAKAAIASAIAFLETIEWTNQTSEGDAEDVRVELEEALAAYEREAKE